MAALLNESRFPPTRPGERIEVALSFPADPAPGGALVFSPQPFLGGDMDNNVVLRLAHCLARSGLPVLRFNYRSVGNSEQVEAAMQRYEYWKKVEETGDHRAVLEDAAEAWARAQRLFQPTFFCGYSFGAYVAMQLAVRQASAVPLILVAPPVGRLDFSALLEREGPSLLVFAGKDEIDPTPPRSELARRFAESRLDIIDGAGHFFIGRENSLDASITPFLREFGLQEESG